MKKTEIGICLKTKITKVEILYDSQQMLNCRNYELTDDESSLVHFGSVIFLTQLNNSTIYFSIHVSLWQCNHEEKHSWDYGTPHQLLQATFLIFWYSSCLLWKCSECYPFFFNFSFFNVTASKVDWFKLSDSLYMELKHSSSFILSFFK